MEAACAGAMTPAFQTANKATVETETVRNFMMPHIAAAVAVHIESSGLRFGSTLQLEARATQSRVAFRNHNATNGIFA
jgi:hypothetical protein